MRRHPSHGEGGRIVSSLASQGHKGYGIHTTQFRPTPSSDSLLKGRWLWTYGYGPIVGHFGDVRLKKGVPIFWIGWLRAGASAFACAALVVIVQVGCTLRDGFGTHR